MWILPRTNVDKAVVLRVKSHVKYQDKKVGLVKDVGPMAKEEIKAPREHDSRVVRLLESNKKVIA